MQTDRLRNGGLPVGRPNLAGQLDLFRLVVFHTLVNEGTMSNASERLFITQPAISAHIKALERGLGVTLFDRVGRGSVVNSAGRVLYQKAEQLFAVADELKAEMEDLRGSFVGRLRLGASIVWQYHLPAALDRFQEQYPHVELSTQVDNSDRIEKLVQDRSVDIGFIGRATPRAELFSEHLTDDELVPIYGPAHPLAARTDLRPGELDGESFVVREVGSATRHATDEVLMARGITPKNVMELGSLEAIKRVVMAGEGIGMVSREGSELELSAGLLAIGSVMDLRSSLHLHLIHHRRKKLTGVQRAFLDLMVSDRVIRPMPNRDYSGRAGA